MEQNDQNMMATKAAAPAKNHRFARHSKQMRRKYTEQRVLLWPVFLRDLQMALRASVVVLAILAGSPPAVRVHRRPADVGSNSNRGEEKEGESPPKKKTKTNEVRYENWQRCQLQIRLRKNS